MAETIVTLSGDDKALFQALQRIVGQQDKADAGFKKMKASSKDASESVLKGVNDAVSSLGKMVVGYASVTTAIQLANTAIQSQIELNNEAKQSFDAVAKAQQEAAKNLAGVSSGKISEALQKEVPAIAIEASFKDLPAITKALGSSASIVGDEIAKSVVATAAKLEKLTPENLQTTATSTADLVKATGVKDAREAMALLLSAGSVARPEELGRLSLGAARAVNAGTLSAPGQDKVQAAKEATALFAMLSKVDKSGESAATATVQLLAQLRELFKGREDDPGTIRGRLEAIQGSQDLQKGFLGEFKGNDLLAELKEEFVKDLKGEAIFKPIFESLTDTKSTDSAELANALKTVTTDVKVFEEALKTLDLTPQQKLANAQASAQTAVAVQKFGDAPRASAATIRETYEEAVKNTNVTTGQFLREFFIRQTGLLSAEEASTDPATFGRGRIADLEQRRAALLRQPQSAEIDDKIQTVNAAIQSIERAVQVANTPREFINDELAKQNEVMREQTGVLKEISRKLGGQAQPNSPPAATVPTNSTSNAINAGRP